MFDKVRIVLIQTSHPGNIGAVARAMKNMGFARLYLVSPQEFPSPEAVWRAAGAADVLDGAIVVDTLEQAVEGCHLIVGASARGRRIPWPVVSPRKLAQEIGVTPSEEIALIFGREDRGLTNEELQRCNWHVHIPANPEYSALNLAMAVQVVTYELRMHYLMSLENQQDVTISSVRPDQLANASGVQDPADSLSMMGPEEAGWDVESATSEEVELYIGHLEQTLIEIGFHDPANPRQLMTRLRRLYQRCRLDKMEVNILRGILKTTQQIAGKQSRN